MQRTQIFYPQNLLCVQGAIFLTLILRRQFLPYLVIRCFVGIGATNWRPVRGQNVSTACERGHYKMWNSSSQRTVFRGKNWSS